VKWEILKPKIEVEWESDGCF